MQISAFPTPRSDLSIRAARCANAGAGLRRRALALAVSLATLVAVSTHAHAQNGSLDDDGNVVYGAEYFREFSPQTALDIIRRTPGFVLDTGIEARGFGATAGNVLIDGQRPTVKTGGITDVLQRIPAARVERVVLMRSGENVSQAQGQSLIANVVLREAESEGEGTVTARFALQRNGWVAATGEISYEKPIGNWTIGGSYSYDSDKEDIVGRYRIFDRNDITTQYWRESAPSHSIERATTLSLQGPVANGDFAFNMRLGNDDFRDRIALEVRQGASDGPVLSTPRFNFDEAYHEVEIGSDWSRKHGEWTTKLVVLGRQSKEDVVQASFRPTRRTLTNSLQRAQEAVFRATFARAGEGRFQPEFGVETAFNRLDTDLYYAETIGGVLTPIALPGSDTEVSELRTESFLTVSARLSPRWRAVGGIAAEWSRIRVQGDLSREQRLRYLKPSITFTWDASERTKLRAELRQKVDQLDFEEFAASVENVDDRPISGNASIRPARTTRSELRLEHRWGDEGVVTLRTFGEWRRGVLDYVPTESGGQAIGIAGDGRLFGVSLQTTIPLDALLPNATLTTSTTWRRSRLFPDSPVIDSRPLSGVPELDASLAFRHDPENLGFSWGFDLIAPRRTTVYYVDETEETRRRMFASAFIETTLIEGFRTTLTVFGLSGNGSDRRIRFFDTPGTGERLGGQWRDRERGTQVILTFVRPL